jgi:protein-S-isoprenylcysteine O-methyltransferase Ste14
VSALDAKVPPPVVMLLVGAAMAALARVSPSQSPPVAGRAAAAMMIGATGLMIELAGIASFAHARTTADPTHPRSARALVVTGVYRFTRNPMYLGDLVMLIAWDVFLMSPAALLLPLVFVAYIRCFQIAPEEQAMSDLFGDRYREYVGRVRRWV